MEGKVLKKDFYKGETLGLAQRLLGKVLVRRRKDQKLLKGKIVETEAYCGPKDKASHSSAGITKRTKVMFGPYGHAYIYLIYGVHHCLNVVAEEEGEAVLIRAVEPLGDYPQKIASGPGKLTRWMKIDKSLNGWNLTKKSRLWVEKGESPRKIRKSTRIGVDYAGEWAQKEWRFFIPSSSLSR